MENDNQYAKDFFNQISDTYKNKYNPDQVFHYYFFTERLNKAAGNISLVDKKILDIGAGTGDLYDYLISRDKSILYTGTDVSEGMLGNSSIPTNCRLIGTAPNMLLPYASYDYIFMLGVSTYLTDIQMKEYLELIKNKSNNETEIIVTFTNGKSIDNLTRTLLKPLLIFLSMGKRSVLSQKIFIKKYSVNEAKDLINKNGFEVLHIDYLNHTVFPFNLLAKKLSVLLAKKLDRIQNKKILSLLSSDIIIRFKLTRNA